MTERYTLQGDSREAVLIIERLPGDQGYAVSWYFDDGKPVPTFTLSKKRVGLAVNMIIDACFEVEQ